MDYYRENVKKVAATRAFLSRELPSLGFSVFPSQTNFILVRPPGFPAREWLQRLRERKVLVRWFDHAGIHDYLRITVGTEKEAGILVKVIRTILREPQA